MYKLSIIHAAGLYGLYVLLTSHVNPLTLLLGFVLLQLNGLLILISMRAMLIVTNDGVPGMGITAGYHRFWAHKSYELSPVVQYVLAWQGAAAGEGSILWWARDHRMHHKYGDTERVCHASSYL